MDPPPPSVPVESPTDYSEHYRPLMEIPPQGQWSTGLFGCMSDVPNCCLTCWCPWITFGQNVEIIDRGVSSCGVSGALYGIIAILSGCQWIYACTYRSKLKRQYGIPPSYLKDGCTHIICHPCALCQEQRELEHHGFDVSLGWYGNMELKGEIGVANPPVVPGGMTR